MIRDALPTANAAPRMAQFEIDRSLGETLIVIALLVSLVCLAVITWQGFTGRDPKTIVIALMIVVGSKTIGDFGIELRRSRR